MAYPQPQVPARLPALSFFFPVYDEEDNVGPMVEEALAALPRLADEFEILIVDDGSRDRTPELADALAAAHPQVRVIHHRPNRGYGAAIRTGLLAASKPFICYTDGDRQFRVADLERLVDALDGADIVIGYRLKRADPLRRRLIAWVYNRLIGLLFGGGFKDVDCALKLFRREVFERAPLAAVRSNGAFFSPELLVTLQRAGVRIRQVGVPHHARVAHEPKGAPPRVILRAMRDLALLRMRLWF